MAYSATTVLPLPGRRRDERPMHRVERVDRLELEPVERERRSGAISSRPAGRRTACTTGQRRRQRRRSRSLVLGVGARGDARPADERSRRSRGPSSAPPARPCVIGSPRRRDHGGDHDDDDDRVAPARDQRRGVSTPTSWRNTSSTGNSKPMPNAAIISPTRPMYLLTWNTWSTSSPAQG